MTFEQYIKVSARTSANDSLEHAALGMCGEMMECAEAAKMGDMYFYDELGDLCWYMAMAYRCLDTTPVFSTPLFFYNSSRFIYSDVLFC